jgi:glycosyltransferase involved in cell wall biosynthesis
MSTQDSAQDTPALDVVIPVYNEQHVLAASVRTLHDALSSRFDGSFRITIANNASTDDTLRTALALRFALPSVRVLHLERKGRGRALRRAWATSDAGVVAYMDVDLSTDLAALGDLVGPLLDGSADLAIGSRLARGAEVTRGARRELISRGYNLLLRAVLGVGFSDAQCGFKAGRRDVVAALLPEVHDESWFFDTELLCLAERRGLRIHEVPVRWVEDPDSRVRILATAREDLRGILRLRRARRARRRSIRCPDVRAVDLSAPSRRDAHRLRSPVGDRALPRGG